MLVTLFARVASICLTYVWLLCLLPLINTENMAQQQQSLLPLAQTLANAGVIASQFILYQFYAFCWWPQGGFVKFAFCSIIN